MRLKIQAIKRKEMPSSFGGKPWNITSVKFDGIENPIYGFDLAGFGTKADKLAAGDMISGYITKKTYTKKDGTQGSNQMFNAISADYVYDLLLKINPEIENIQTRASVAATIPPMGARTNTAVEMPTDEINPEEIPF